MPSGSYWMSKNQFLSNLIMDSSRLSTEFSESPSPSFDDQSQDFNEYKRKRKSQSNDETDDYPAKKHCSNHKDSEMDDKNQAKVEQNSMCAIGQRLMQKMGYTEGKGLGKKEQGRLHPVEAFQQRGRRGLGHDNTQLSEAKLKWDPSAEVVSVQEDIIWINNNDHPLSSKDLQRWMVIGPSKRTIDDEVTFCDPHIIKQVVNSKSIFDSLGKNEMRRARTRSNPYETIRGAFFLNRAAVKMANIDRACDFMFTRPVIIENEPLFFADVCAGPGGFSEYVLWRKKWESKGFGFTLKDSNDFKLEDFYAGSPETFHPFYGPKEDGNVYDPENQKIFQKLVLEQTRNRGVHFMMSDGGFSVEGEENIQEILSKQLYLCQCLVALMIIREGGHFVTKLFDLFTPFSAGLVYLMYRCFKRVCIFKPNTSRPANSERYLICQHKLPDTQHVIDYMFNVNLQLLKGDKNNDVMELVPLEILQNDDNFFQYLKQSNDSLGAKQVVGLLKIAAYCEDPTLVEHRQAQIRKECLQYWDLPDITRTRPRDVKADVQVQCLLSYNIRELAKMKPGNVTENLQSTILESPCDWYCVPCEAKDYNNDDGNSPTFFFGMGRTKVYKLIRNTWQRVDNFQLPPDTLVYAEVVKEFRGQQRIQRRTTALHIIDAWLLGSKNVSQMFLPERHEQINKFCEALWAPENKSLIRVRAKNLHFLDNDLEQELKIKVRSMKNGATVMGHHPGEPSYSYESRDNNKEELYFVPNSIIFLKSTQSPWSLHLSRTHGKHYFSNKETHESVYNDRRPDSAVASFKKTFESRMMWYWPHDKALDLPHLCSEIKAKCPYNPSSGHPY